MKWSPLRTVPDTFIGRSILVWVPKNQCVFAVVPYGSRGRDLQWWGATHQREFPHRATQWMPMPKPPAKKRRTR
jgi:hypothetical protein